MGMKNIQIFWFILICVALISFVLIYLSYENGGFEMSYTGEVISPVTTLEDSYMDISPMDAMDLIKFNPELVVIDVSRAYDAGHLPGAVNYYVGDGSLDRAIPYLDRDVAYLVYCHVESASRLGAQKLIDAGFENVYRLEGEYDAWVEAGYGVEF